MPTPSSSPWAPPAERRPGRRRVGRPRRARRPHGVPGRQGRAERATAERLGDRLLLARPGLIVGPGDSTDRFGYWPARLHRGGRVLVPTPEGRFVQVIDVDDLAAWLVVAGRAGATGAVNAVGTPVTWADFLALAQGVTSTDVETVPVDDATLLAHDVRHWAGPRSLPLCVPVADAGFAQRDNAAYLAAGGTLRPLRETIARTLADEVARGVGRPRRSGLTADEERAVLAAL